VNTFSVEDRTRTYQTRQGVYLRRGAFDEQFDCQLPEEARTELLYRIREIAAYQPGNPNLPVRRIRKSAQEKRAVTAAARAVIGTIAIVVFLYAVLRTDGPSTSTARSVPTPILSPPVEVRRALPVEVRRALPAVPRALPVDLSANTVSNAQWQPIRMPDGTIVNVSYQGELPSSAALPPQGHFVGEAYSTGTTSWVWMTPAGANFPSWVDP
jgi:hypothetical protein